MSDIARRSTSTGGSMRIYACEPGVRAAGMAIDDALEQQLLGDDVRRSPAGAPEPGGRSLSAIDQHVTPGYAAAAGVRHR